MTKTLPRENAARTLEENAQLILRHAHRMLLKELPDFLPVIWLLKDEACDRPGGLWTDGVKLYYHPKSVVQDYLIQRKRVMLQLFHILVHGLLGHYAKRQGQEEALFDAVADIKAAGLTRCLSSSWLPKLPEKTWELLNWAQDKSLEACYLTPHTWTEVVEVRNRAQPLRVDDHSAWFRRRDGGQDNGGTALAASLWTVAAQQVAANMARRAQWGHVAGEISAVYRNTQASSVSYREFLQRFACNRERQMVDPDSINRIWYHVGLEQTGDIPFVEPEELMEDAEIIRLAVALDTSGSCCGEVMGGFLQELLAILRDSGRRRLSITLIQCDTEIQSVRTLSCDDSAAELMEIFQMEGGGGTDFCPVFAYLNQRQKEGAEEPIQGLLFLSDGCGEFPATPPPYPVAFLFPREPQLDVWMLECDNIPAWVTKVSIADDNSLEVVEGEQT